MQRLQSRRIEFIRCTGNNNRDQFAADIFRGFTSDQKYIPSKYLYDERGSSLFEQICDLPEYYPTRVEMNILENAAASIVSGLDRGDLIELGAGGNRKIKLILDAAGPSRLRNIRYVPVDVCESVLKESSRKLAAEYPDLKVCCVAADFTRSLNSIPDGNNKLITFFGSTIGNLTEQQCTDMLTRIGLLMQHDDRLVVGMDMVKSKQVLEAAYDDAEEITAAFNKNILNVLNRELDADFEDSHYDHFAFYDDEKARVEMHLRANRDTMANIGKIGLQIRMQRGETILTEISRKFDWETIQKIAGEAGMKISRWFTDEHRWFSLVELTSVHAGKKDNPRRRYQASDDDEDFELAA